jgi:putative membrane protein
VSEPIPPPPPTTSTVVPGGVPPEGAFRRLHPLTPVLRGWKVFAAVVAVAAQQAYGDVSVPWLLAAVAASIPVGVAYGWLSWRVTRYRVGPDVLRLETGLLHKRSRQVRLDRLQSVDVVRPLVARVLGLAELRLEVAGGGGSEAPLAYLSEDAALRLRAELLARAAGLHHETPEAPENVLLEVPLSRLVEASLRSVTTLFALVGLVALVVAALLVQSIGLLGFAVPFAVAAVPAAVNGVIKHFGFTVAESPDGLRLRYGLLETRAQTVPPGRVQAVRLTEPLLWRSQGWCRVEVDVAGYVGEGQEAATVLCPVAPRSEALRVLSRVLPGLDVDAVQTHGVPRNARFVDPFAWTALGVGTDDRVLVTRRGRLTRVTDVVLHEKVQSVRLVQGPLQRRLGLASVHLDTTPGPVTAVAPHRDAHEARRLVDAEVEQARLARLAAGPDRWMTPPPSSPAPTVQR